MHTLLKAAAFAPKLGKHASSGETPSHSHSALDQFALLRQMVPTARRSSRVTSRPLRKLSDYQKAARQKDPVKAKAKQRFVTGLRQCMIGTKTGTKLILLATDTERSQELDAQLSAHHHRSFQKEASPYHLCPESTTAAKGMSSQHAPELCGHLRPARPRS